MGTRLLTAPVRSAGIVLGRDRRERPVVARIFASRPIRITVVGDEWLAKLLLFRSLAIGARVLIRTATPDRWTGFGEAATLRTDRVLVAGDQPIPAQVSGPAQPMLVLDDFGQSALPTEPPAWCAHVTLLRQLGPRGVNALAAADLRIFQRLSAPEAAVAAATLRLDERPAMRLQALFDDMISVAGGDLDREVWLFPTPIEVELLGKARRA